MYTQFVFLSLSRLYVKQTLTTAPTVILKCIKCLVLGYFEKKNKEYRMVSFIHVNLLSLKYIRYTGKCGIKIRMDMVTILFLPLTMKIGDSL